MRMLTRTLAIAAAAVLVACGGASSRGARQPRPSPDVLTRADLEPLAGITARQAIERLRPRFLRSRGTTSIMNANADRIWVYVDNARLGGIEVLDQLQVHDIGEIRYLNGPDATNRFGMGHTAGAIVITRRT